MIHQASSRRQLERTQFALGLTERRERENGGSDAEAARVVKVEDVEYSACKRFSRDWRHGDPLTCKPDAETASTSSR